MVSCKPEKSKRRKVYNFKIEGELGVYTITFNINPSQIQKASLNPKPRRQALPPIPIPLTPYYFTDDSSTQPLSTPPPSCLPGAPCSTLPPLPALPTLSPLDPLSLVLPSPSCQLGYSQVCTPDQDRKCPQDLELVCFGSKKTATKSAGM